MSKVILSGHIGSDEGLVVLDTVTGVITRTPGNRIEDVRHALQILRLAAEIGDAELRKAAIQASGNYLNGETVSEILGPSSTVVVFL
jgi:hypothetical protein